MKAKRGRKRSAPSARAQYIFCALITLAVLLMVVPVSTALVAGIASVSLVLFGIASLLLLALLISGKVASRTIVLATLTVTLFGALTPQLAFLKTATQADVALAFDPIKYVTFSGVTTISPSRVITYKSAGAHKLKLAVYAASQSGPRPAVALLHGGGWRYGSYLETGDWPRKLTEAGFTVISIEYRLSSDTYHTWRDAPADVHDAMTYIKEHAVDLSADRERLTLFGQSAGGHLALLEAYRNQTTDSVISFYAPIDLALDYTTSRDKSAELDFIGGPPGQYPDRYEALSPSNYLNDSTPRTLLIQGKSDDLVDPANARLLSELLTQHEVEHELLLLPLTGHSFENQHGGFATQITTQKVLRFLTK